MGPHWALWRLKIHFEAYKSAFFLLVAFPLRGSRGAAYRQSARLPLEAFCFLITLPMRCTLLIRNFDRLTGDSLSFWDSAGVWVSGGQGSLCYVFLACRVSCGVLSLSLFGLLHCLSLFDFVSN